MAVHMHCFVVACLCFLLFILLTMCLTMFACSFLCFFVVIAFTVMFILGGCIYFYVSHLFMFVPFGYVCYFLQCVLYWCLYLANLAIAICLWL